MKRNENRKAQSGMEYLMTYGWAVLVVGIVILLLMSLRVLDVDWFSVTNSVYGLSTFKVPDFKATPHPVDPNGKTVLIFQLINQRGTNVTIEDITFEGSDGVDYSIGYAEPAPPPPRFYVWYCPIDSPSCTFVASAFPFNMSAGQRFIVNGTIKIPGEINTVFTSTVIIKYNSPRSTINHTDTGKFRGRVEAAS